jgi:hypothetical protein
MKKNEIFLIKKVKIMNSFISDFKKLLCPFNEIELLHVANIVDELNYNADWVFDTMEQAEKNYGLNRDSIDIVAVVYEKILYTAKESIPINEGNLFLWFSKISVNGNYKATMFDFTSPYVQEQLYKLINKQKKYFKNTLSKEVKWVLKNTGIVNFLDNE